MCFVVSIFEIIWILCMFCYLKQEETKDVSQNKVTWFGEQMDKIVPKIGKLIDTPANLMQLKEPVDDAVKANNNERSKTNTNQPPNDKPKQSTSSSKLLDKSVAEDISNQTSSKEPQKDDITITNNVPVEKHLEPLPGDKSKLDDKNDSQTKSEQTSSLNVLIVNNETQPTS